MGFCYTRSTDDVLIKIPVLKSLETKLFPIVVKLFNCSLKKKCFWKVSSVCQGSKNAGPITISSISLLNVIKKSWSYQRNLLNTSTTTNSCVTNSVGFCYSRSTGDVLTTPCIDSVKYSIIQNISRMITKVFNVWHRVCETDPSNCLLTVQVSANSKKKNNSTVFQKQMLSSSLVNSHSYKMVSFLN